MKNNNKIKKIIHITNDLQRLGGVQRLLVDLITLQKNEFEFEVILTRGENEYSEELKALGVAVYHKRDIGLFGLIKRLNRADLVHAHLFPSIYIALLTTTKTVITEHNSHYRRRDILFVKMMEAVLYRKYSKIICISEGVREAFLSSIKVKDSLTTVIHNGVNLNRFPRIAKQINTNKKVFKLGMVGRLVAQKDIKTLLELMAKLDGGFELHLAGDGELRSEFEAYSVKLNVQKNVVFHGQVNDIPEFLSSIDLYIQSSHWEGFGIAIVEAMAAGLPCLATNVDGLNNVIGKEYLFEVGDVTRLAEKVLALKASNELYNASSKYSIKQSSLFSIENTSYEHKKVYLDCTSNT